MGPACFLIPGSRSDSRSCPGGQCDKPTLSPCRTIHLASSPHQPRQGLYLPLPGRPLGCHRALELTLACWQDRSLLWGSHWEPLIRLPWPGRPACSGRCRLRAALSGEPSLLSLPFLSFLFPSFLPSFLPSFPSPASQGPSLCFPETPTR